MPAHDGGGTHAVGRRPLEGLPLNVRFAVASCPALRRVKSGRDLVYTGCKVGILLTPTDRINPKWPVALSLVL
jgi:hypothetical protein